MATQTRGKSGRPAARSAPRPAPDHEQDPAEPARQEQPAEADTSGQQEQPQKSMERTSTTRRRSTRPPDQVPQEGQHSKRLTLPITPEDHRALKHANIEDEIDTTVRLRAMIALWRQDDRLRARIDKLAHKMS